MISGMKNAQLLGLAGLIMTLGWLSSFGAAETDWSIPRKKMLDAIARDVARHGAAMGCSQLSEGVARAMAKVPRHLFVPERYRAHAYDNNPLPIGQGQTISQPTIVAVMTELMAISPGDTILEVGTGSGYQAAILAELAAQVHTIEIIPELAESAGRVLADLKYRNIKVHVGDGYAGLPQYAPFAAIMVTAAPPEIPDTLLDQLKPGGLLVAPVGPRDGTQWLSVWRKKADGDCEKQVIIPVRFVPMVKGTGR
jgi:protein-L-isoaspartate(D-aspartate) O-methyltransferase